jgi:hypothetical protein
MVMGGLECCMQLRMVTSPYTHGGITEVFWNVLISTRMGMQLLLQVFVSPLSYCINQAYL